MSDLMERPEAGAAVREHRASGVIGVGWVECPAFKNDRGRGQVSQEGYVGDAEAPEALSGVRPQHGLPGADVGNEHDRGHVLWRSFLDRDLDLDDRSSSSLGAHDLAIIGRTTYLARGVNAR